MIKDASELTAQEITEFRKVFIKYFNESCIITAGKKPKFLESFMTSVRSRTNANCIIEMIKERDKEGFVSLDDAEESISGFLIGDIENGVGVITHFFIDVKCPVGRRIQSLELFKAFSQKMTSKGISKVVAHGSINDKEIDDTLSSLGFSISKTSTVDNEYVRSI